jgi:DNA-binding NarL/FixJ family response regulator
MGSAEIVTAFSMHRISVIALTEKASVEGFEEVAIAGGKGYVDKRSDPSDIVSAALTILDGRSWVAREFVNRTGRLTSVVSLSEQEHRSLVLYASGMTQQMVARRMGIAPSTVKHYLDRVRQKYTDVGLTVRTKLELHAIARREGWLP